MVIYRCNITIIFNNKMNNILKKNTAENQNLKYPEEENNLPIPNAAE